MPSRKNRRGDWASGEGRGRRGAHGHPHATCEAYPACEAYPTSLPRGVLRRLPLLLPHGVLHPSPPLETRRLSSVAPIRALDLCRSSCVAERFIVGDTLRPATRTSLPRGASATTIALRAGRATPIKPQLLYLCGRFSHPSAAAQRFRGGAQRHGPCRLVGALRSRAGCRAWRGHRPIKRTDKNRYDDGHLRVRREARGDTEDSASCQCGKREKIDEGGGECRHSRADQRFPLPLRKPRNTPIN